MPAEIKLRSTVYNDGEIHIALVTRNESEADIHLALRWLAPEPVRKQAKVIKTTNLMGGETGWFIVPFSLAVGIARVLVEQRSAGLDGFDHSGYSEMVQWLVDLDEFNDCMCY